MGNYKFYTPPEVAECLMTVLPEKKYKNVIDICCGSWNLLKAANKVHIPQELRIRSRGTERHSASN